MNPGSSVAAMKPSGSSNSFWPRILELYPAMRSEYVQVLVLVAVPLIVFLAALLADLRIRRRVLDENGDLIFRASLAVRCAWMLGILALLSHAMLTRNLRWITVTADLLAVLELLRTFPRNLTIAPDGLRWRNFGGWVSLRWEHVSCFARTRSTFGAEYKLCGDAGQTFAFASVAIPQWRQIVQRIFLGLDQRHLKPSSALSRNALDRLHRFLLPACIIIIVFGNYIQH
jgi:hypothetical protein